jgi:hypothetical protein
MTDLSRTPGTVSWCALCGTRHVSRAACPRENQATGPEVAAWKVGAHTPRGVQGIGVMRRINQNQPVKPLGFAQAPGFVVPDGILNGYGGGFLARHASVSASYAASLSALSIST